MSLAQYALVSTTQSKSIPGLAWRPHEEAYPTPVCVLRGLCSAIKKRVDDTYAAEHRPMLHVFAEQLLAAAGDGSLENQCVIEGQTVQHMQIQRAGHQFRTGRHDLKAAVEGQAIADQRGR